MSQIDKLLLCGLLVLSIELWHPAASQPTPTTAITTTGTTTTPNPITITTNGTTTATNATTTATNATTTAPNSTINTNTTNTTIAPTKPKISKPTVMRFSYDENDPKGPKHWAVLPGARDTTNYCGKHPVTPLNIIPDRAQAIISRESHPDNDQEMNDSDDLDIDKTPQLSLFFDASPKAQRHSWYLTQPEDIYHGLEIRGTDTLTQLTVSDQFDSQLGHGLQRTKAETYTINFALITYCNFPPPRGRSSHQINGEIFNVEIHLLFFKESRPMGIDNYINSSRSYIMVSVLGKVDKKNNTDNKEFEPIAKAARAYHGESMDNYEDKKQEIKNFDLHWLIPEDSGYFYYNNGTFPVPPCFQIPRVYVMKEPLRISTRQLHALTNFKTDSEPSGKMPCTFGLLHHEINDYDVMYNRNPVQVHNSDFHGKRKDKGSGGAMSNSKLLFVLGSIFGILRVHQVL